MKRLYSLDALRGIAALSVVIWHWQHFYAFTGTWAEGWQRQAQPFYRLLKPLYLEGWAAVDLFFALSGFVFFWLYAVAIREGTVKPGRFALLRFSRLYPLHFLTLFLVFFLQSAFHNITGDYFIFDAGDWGQFAANLVLGQQWLPPNTDQSFNGPAWTVSVEAGLYVLFFVLCRLGFNGPKSAFAVSLAGIALLDWDSFVARGVMGFFLGGLAYFAVDRVRVLENARRISWALVAISLLLWTAVVIEILYGPIHAALYWLSGHISSEAGEFYIGTSDNIFQVLYVYGVIPVSIVALALHEVVLGGVYKRLSYLGDISFSTYMLHFPLQIAFALFALHFGFTTALFENGWTMIVFYALLIGLGALCYRFYEKPLQRLIRNLSGGKKLPV